MSKTVFRPAPLLNGAVINWSKNINWGITVGHPGAIHVLRNAVGGWGMSDFPENSVTKV